MKKEVKMGKEDKLVDKLVSLFKGISDKDIDKAIKEAKNRLVVEAKKPKYEVLEKLFDSQIQVLWDRGCPDQIIGLLVAQKSSVLSKASKIAFENGHIPFIPVIPQTYRSFYDLMAMVRNGDKRGYVHLDPVVVTSITDKIKTPDKPYYIYDIEDGRRLVGKSPKEAEKILEEQPRSPLTAAEIIALCVHTNVLKHHYVQATGSRCSYDERDMVPDVVLLDIPMLDQCWVNSESNSWGSPSCGSRDL